MCGFVQKLWKDLSKIVKVNPIDLCLIHKVRNPQMVSQSWPMVLYNTIYKLLSKYIMQRLQIVIDKLVSPYQTGFIVGRSIQDNIIVSPKILHSMHQKKGKKDCFVMKIDLTKAYDILN